MQLVSNDKRENDSLKQLLRRLDYIVYHYIENGLYKEFRLPASEYVNYEDLKRRVYESQSIIKENEAQEDMVNNDAKVTIKLVNVQEVHNEEN